MEIMVWTAVAAKSFEEITETMEHEALRRTRTNEIALKQTLNDLDPSS